MPRVNREEVVELVDVYGFVRETLFENAIIIEDRTVDFGLSLESGELAVKFGWRYFDLCVDVSFCEAYNPFVLSDGT